MPDQGIERSRLEAFYLSFSGGRRFCMLHEPARPAPGAGAVLYLHPFAEEMNKSRRMAALQSRALASIGWTVLQVDLQGCGDSEADFGEATWEGWIADAVESAAWLGRRCGRAPWLWGLRSGCLVATAAAAKMPAIGGLLFWQPVLSGRQFVQQFLRLKVASQILESPQTARADTRALREEFARGNGVEIAGYHLSPSLALGIDTAELAPIPGKTSIIWIEVSSAGATLSPAARARAAQWRDAGHVVREACVDGEAFWQTQEIAECPALVRTTLAALPTVAI